PAHQRASTQGPSRLHAALMVRYARRARPMICTTRAPQSAPTRPATKTRTPREEPLGVAEITGSPIACSESEIEPDEELDEELDDARAAGPDAFDEAAAAAVAGTASVGGGAVAVCGPGLAGVAGDVADDDADCSRGHAAP